MAFPPTNRPRTLDSQATAGIRTTAARQDARCAFLKDDMTTTQDIMKLARAYAKAYMSFQEAGELRALQSAVDALVAERDTLQQANEAFNKRQEWWNERMLALEAEKATMQATEMPEPIMLMIPNAKESAVFTLDQLQQAHAAGYAKGLAQQARLDDAGRQEPVGTLNISRYKGNLENYDFDYFGELPDGTYTLCACVAPEPPATADFFKTIPHGQNLDGAAPQAAAPQPLKYNTWTHNDGDSWSEHPADAEIIYDLLGDSPKVGDEFQLRASVESVQQTYRITSVSPDGECEVELVEDTQGIGAKP